MTTQIEPQISTGPGTVERTPAPSPAIVKVQVPRDAIAIQLPPERPDYTGDLLSGGIGLVGGLIGALAGAYAAYRLGMRAARSAREDEASERRSFLEFSLITKLSRIYSAQGLIRKHLEEGEGRVRAKADQAAPRKNAEWVRHLMFEVNPFANLPAPVAFETDELRVAAKIVSDAVMSEIMVLDERHNASLEVAGTYRRLKAEYDGLSEGTGRFVKDGYVEITLTPEQYEALKPRIYAMDSLLEALAKSASEDEQAAYKALVEVLVARRVAGGDKVDLKIIDPKGRKMQITPKGAVAIAVATPPEGAHS